MTFQESETLELKEIVVEDIKKEIIAFANSAGERCMWELLIMVELWALIILIQ